MKFGIFTTALAVFSGLVSSAPVTDAKDSAHIEARTSKLIYPNFAVGIYSPDGGYTTNSAYISRYTYNGQQYDTNTLLSFYFPEGYSKATCSFVFNNAWYSGGTRKVQLFSVGSPITATNTFTSRPHRDTFYGIFTISEDGSVGTFDNNPAPSFPCPSSTTTLNFEVTPQGDSDWAGWDLNAGLAIEVNF